MIDARCRVTVIGARNRVDLAVPAEAPIADYSDMLAELCEQPADAALPSAWSLAPAGKAPFALTSSLASEGVTDGAILYLRDTLDGEEQEPVVHSVWELVSDQVDQSGGTRWDTRTGGRLALLLAAGWLIAAFGYLGLTDRRGVGLGILATVLGVGMAVLARVLRPQPRVLPGRLRTLFGCAVVPCLMVVAFLAPGDPRFDVRHLVHLEIGAVVGLVIALILVPDVLLAAITLLVVLTGALTAVLVPLQATADAVAATVAVAAVLLIAVAPRTAGALVAASWLSMSSSTVEPGADPQRVADRVRLAQRTQVLIVTVCSIAAGVALVVLTRSADPYALAVAAVGTVALFVRIATFEFTAEAVAPSLAASAGLFGLITLLDRGEASGVLTMPVLIVAGVAAIGTALPLLLWAPRSAQERKPRWGMLLTVCQVVLPALLLGVYGLYSTLWNLGS